MTNNTTTTARPSFMDRSHPEYRAEMQEEKGDAQAATTLELIATAKQIDGFRNSRKNRPSDRNWVKQWPALGSAKTWSAILRSKLESVGVDHGKWLSAYRGVLTALQTDIEERAQESLYGDLTSAESVSLATLRLQHHRGKDRLILIEGTSGSGKTSCLDLLTEGEGSRGMLKIEATETWRGPRNFLYALLRELDQGSTSHPIPYGTHERLEKAITLLNARGRVMIAMDEAHHCNGPILNTIKTILNRTEALFILAAMDTLFRKLRASAHEEAKQIYHNRLFARIVLTAPTPEDARVFLERRLGLKDGSAWKNSTLTHLCAMSKSTGMWAFFRRLAVNLNESCEPADDVNLLAAGEAAAREIA